MSDQTDPIDNEAIHLADGMRQGLEAGGAMRQMQNAIDKSHGLAGISALALKALDYVLTEVLHTTEVDIDSFQLEAGGMASIKPLADESNGKKYRVTAARGRLGS